MSWAETTTADPTEFKSDKLTLLKIVSLPRKIARERFHLDIRAFANYVNLRQKMLRVDKLQY